MPQEHSVRTIIISTVAVLVVAGGVLYYRNDKAQKEKQVLIQRQYQDAKAIHRSGDNTEAINAFNSLINTAPDQATLGKAKILKATNLYLRNEGDDIAQGVKLYKEVINDRSFPPYVRALALNSVATIVRGEDETFYRLYFSEPPFNNFSAESGKGRFSVFPIYLKILELSDETFPNSFAEYAIAGNYYAPLLTNNVSIGTTTPEQAAKIMDNYIKKADVANDEQMYSPNVTLERYLYRAIAINTIGRTLKKDNLDEREKAFKLILEKGAPYEIGSEDLSRFIVMNGRFFYANFLSQNFGKERYSDISNILKPFEEATSVTDSSFKTTRLRFAKLQNVTDNDPVKKMALSLAKVSPEFKDFLLSVGFKFK